jgi:hypothetical protein
MTTRHTKPALPQQALAPVNAGFTCLTPQQTTLVSGGATKSIWGKTSGSYTSHGRISTSVRG